MKLTIFKRLFLGFFILLLAVTAIGVYATLKLDQLNQIIDSVSSVDTETIRLVNNLKGNLLTQRKFDKMYAVSQDQDFQHQYLEAEKYIQRDLAQASLITDKLQIEKLLSEVRRLYDQYLAIVENEGELIEGNQEYDTAKYEEEKEEISGEMIRRLEDVLILSEKSMSSKIEASEEIGSQTLRVVAVITILSVILGILIAYFNSRTINRPLIHLIQGTKEIARGKFDEHITIGSPPEIHELANAFNHMCDRLKELDEMKADLIAHISHEFRTPLAVMREAVSLHRECLHTGPIEKQQKLLSIIEEESERLILSVKKVLDLSRMEAGMDTCQIEKNSMSQLIEASVVKIRPIAERRNIALVKSLDENLPAAAMDMEKIGQVLDNLLDNAIKFTPKGGKTSIRATLRNGMGSENPAKVPQDFIEVAVEDTGIGIPEESIDNIFDKFNKLHEKGTGLGLYIARQIIRAHGGEIWVKSENNSGSTFFFTVPAC